MTTGIRRHVLVLLAVFVLSLPLVNPYIRGDGNEYYAYLRSLVIDGDLQFENEYRRGDPAFLVTLNGDLRVTSTGHRRNFAAVGPSLLWAPFFLIAHGAVTTANAVGWPLAADGYSWPYRWLCAIGTASYAFAGLLLAFRVASTVSRPAAACIATLGVWFASSLPVYMYFLPFHVHALGSFTVALFVWIWVATDGSRKTKEWTWWGAAGGLVVETYYLNAVVLLIAGLEYLRLWKGDGKEQRDLRTLVVCGLSFGMAMMIVLLPTLIIKGIIHGSPFDMGYPPRLFYWTDPRLIAVGFAAEHGAFLWTPILLAAVLGLAWLAARRSRVGAVLTVTGATFYYVLASYTNWHGHSSYGSRFFVALTPMFVIGLAVLVDGVYRALPRKAAALIVTLFVALVTWNVGLMLQWGTNLVPNRGPVDFQAVLRNQVTEVPTRIGGFVLRYLRTRDAVVREIEQDDLAERERFQLRR